MKKIYDFPASAESMLKSYRKHAEDLLKTTDFLALSHGYQRISYFALLDDLLSYLYYIENGRLPGESFANIPVRPMEFGPFKLTAWLDDKKIKNEHQI